MDLSGLVGTLYIFILPIDKARTSFISFSNIKTQPEHYRCTYVAEHIILWDFMAYLQLINSWKELYGKIIMIPVLAVHVYYYLGGNLTWLYSHEITFFFQLLPWVKTTRYLGNSVTIMSIFFSCWYRALWKLLNNCIWSNTVWILISIFFNMISHFFFLVIWCCSRFWRKKVNKYVSVLSAKEVNK